MPHNNLSSIHLSPSVHHRYLMDTLEPRLSFRGRDFIRWQTALRRKLKERLGDMPPTKCPLHVRTLWQREHRFGTIEKIVYTSEPCADVPAYVCIPRNVSRPFRFFICLQGHSSGMHNSIAADRETERKPIKIPGDRDFAIGCMRRGLAALCIEQRSLGLRRERLQKSVSPHGCHDATMQALMLGRTLVGERIWDVERGIDYLAGRGDKCRYRNFPPDLPRHWRGADPPPEDKTHCRVTFYPHLYGAPRAICPLLSRERI